MPGEAPAETPRAARQGPRQRRSKAGRPDPLRRPTSPPGGPLAPSSGPRDPGRGPLVGPGPRRTSDPRSRKETGPVGRGAGGSSASGSRLALSSPVASTPSHRDYGPKPLVTHHLASAARTAATGNTSTKAADRSGSYLGTLRKPRGTKSLAEGLALQALVWGNEVTEAKCESCQYFT